MMEIGKTYRVKINDCCVKGEFTSKLISAKVDVEEDETEMKFENGVVLTWWLEHSVEYEEVQT